MNALNSPATMLFYTEDHRSRIHMLGNLAAYYELRAAKPKQGADKVRKFLNLAEQLRAVQVEELKYGEAEDG